MNFDGILQGLRKLIQPQQQLVSPIPQEHIITPGMASKMAYDDSMEQNAIARRGEPTPTPAKINYSPDIANAPNPQQRNAIKLIRENKPDYKGSDADIVSLYNEHGESLLSDIKNHIGKVRMQNALPKPAHEAAAQVLGAHTTGQGDPAPTPTLVPGANGNRPDIQDIIARYFPDNTNEAINMASYESGLRPEIIQEGANDVVPELGRKSRDYGLFQINDYWQRKNLEKYGYTIDDMLDPEKAANFASILYKAQGGKWGNTWHANKKLGYE